MTVKTRNKLFFVLMIFGFSVAVLTFICILIAFIKGEIFLPEISQVERTFQIFPNSILFKYNPYASLAGIFLFAVSAPVLSGIIIKGFAKTPSLEIVFFGAFIISLITEELRFFIPLTGITRAYEKYLTVQTKIIMGGRILGPMALLFSFCFNKLEQRQNMERNFLILILVSILGGFLMPLNSNKITSTFMVLCGYKKMFLFFNLFIFLATVVLILVDIVVKKNSDLKKVLTSYVILIFGYFILQNTDCWLEFGIAVLLMFFGSYKYLYSIHNLNVWR